MDFLPCHGAQIPYLSPHPFSMARRELTVFFNFLYYFTVEILFCFLFYFPTDQKKYNNTLGFFPLWVWNRLQRKKELKQNKKENNCKEVMFSTQLFHLVYVLPGSNCHLQTTYCQSEFGLLPVPYNLRQNHLKQAQIEKNNTRSVQIWPPLVISYS